MSQAVEETPTETPEFSTARQARHQVKYALSAVRHSFDGAYTPLEGVSGLSKEQQVERFQQALRAVNQAETTVVEKIAAAKERIAAGLAFVQARPEIEPAETFGVDDLDDEDEIDLDDEDEEV